MPNEAAAKPLLKDPYAYDPADVEEPPRTAGGILRRIGPGMILAASIVGSGELIATTRLGAQVGYVALWVIVLACFLKPAIQAEIGRHSVATGATGLEGFNAVPGPRWKVNWIVWAWVLMILATRFQIGAMYGGVAQALNLLVPAVSVEIWVGALLALTLVLLLGGGYERIERLAMLKVGFFTMLTAMCAVLLMMRPEFSWADILGGLRFQLPEQGLNTAIAVFGITGVGASELFMYPYWCVEKGYARSTGEREPTQGWRSRALGWIHVMHVDILASMLIYTVATAAFFLLGAGVLQGNVPEADQLIPRLSRMYTETLGGWSLWLFYPGAIATLYGTIFAATAAESRVGADMVRLMGVFTADDYGSRLKWRNRLVWVLTALGAGLFLIFREPGRMVDIGGAAQSLMLPIIALGALYMRYKRLPKEVIPSAWITIGLWLACVAVGAVMVYYGILKVTAAG